MMDIVQIVQNVQAVQVVVPFEEPRGIIFDQATMAIF